MHVPARFLKYFALTVLIVLAALPAAAQVEDQLSAYTGQNGTGYLQPLADAFGATLNDAFYRTVITATLSAT